MSVIARIECFIFNSPTLLIPTLLSILYIYINLSGFYNYYLFFCQFLLVIKKIEYGSYYLSIIYPTINTTTMTTTIDLLAQRVEILEKQIAALMAHNTTHSDKKSKKHNKSSKSDTSPDPPKKKQISGYILFGKAERDNVKALLEDQALPDTKVKSTDVMKRLGQLWKNLPDADRHEWNAKAKQLPP
tara:strand:+ start:318 stop:878 length:561 start_codon:yes stop_codon:yes gene_type:complete